MELKESTGGALQLVITEKIDEAGKVTKLYRLKGPFQEMNDVRKNKNRNGRRYTKELWENVFKDTDTLERIRTRRMLGELDHPTDDGQIRRSSHIVTAVRPDYEEGIVYGELELINFDQGDAALLKALVEQGVQICVSSRGAGDYLKDGCTIDPKTYRMSTYDVVMDPSVSIAKLNKVAESLNEGLEPEKRASKFAEKIKRESKSEKQTNKESTVDWEKKCEDLMDKNADLKVEVAELKGTVKVSEVNITALEGSVKEKMTKIESTEKGKEDIATKVEELEAASNEAAELLTKVTEEVSTLKEEKETLEAKVKEMVELGDDAADIITKLGEEASANEELSEEAAEVIEKLVSAVKEAKGDKEDDDEDPEDTEKGDDETSDEELKDKKDKKDKKANESKLYENRMAILKKSVTHGIDQSQK